MLMETDGAGALVVCRWCQNLKSQSLQAIHQLPGKLAGMLPDMPRSQLVDDAQTGQGSHQASMEPSDRLAAVRG